MNEDDGQAAHQLELERQQAALQALAECKRAGATSNALDTLAGEIGLFKEWKRHERGLPA